ncbi:MAG: hypothetical protein Q9164_005028 [Protoblastenia rupestris]
MTAVTATRRALADLPVNMLSAPCMNKMHHIHSGQKRPFGTIEESENHMGRPHDQCSRIRGENLAAEPWQNVHSRSISANRLAPAKAPKQDISINHDIIATPPLPPAIINVMAQEKQEAQGDEDSQISRKASLSPPNDFDPDDSVNSQQTVATEVSQPVRSRASQHAEILRLRLRLAQFKLRTNQVDVPFARLRVCTESEKDAPSSRESTAQPSEQPLLPQLLPAPALNPTSNSTRIATEPRSPSSPPVSPITSSAKPASGVMFRTPALPRRQANVEVQQLSSPPDSQEGYVHVGNEDTLTSSAIKGSAAISLLGLRGL